MPKSGRGPFSTKRKREAVLRLLRGENLDPVSRELWVNGSTLAKWRASFLEGGVAEHFIRTLKEQLLWVETFDTVEDLRLA